MSRNYKIHAQDNLHYLTYATVGWVDVFTRPAYKDIVVESLRHCQREKGLELFAWCIMGNHVHLIARAKPGLKLQDTPLIVAWAAFSERRLRLRSTRTGTR